MTGPADLSARSAAKAVVAGSLRAEDLAEAYLDRVRAVEPALRAFVYLDPDLVRAQARAIDRAERKGPLAGLPVGVKDIIDTKDMPTECNSAIYVGRRPTEDADCVDAVRSASGIVFGKTVTTEFASVRPGPTGNPYNLAHTPGGSSSGSAAAVAAGLVPLAFGTQTGGSVIRPASFSGCVGFKATRGTLSLKGVHPLAGDLDTLPLRTDSRRSAPVSRGRRRHSRYQAESSGAAQARGRPYRRLVEGRNIQRLHPRGRRASPCAPRRMRRPRRTSEPLRTRRRRAERQLDRRHRPRL